jgi:hypothetical protein
MRVAYRAAAAGGSARAEIGEILDGPALDYAATDNCPEIECVGALLPADAIDDAAQRAARLGVGADRVLIAAGKLSEDAYLRALCSALGVTFEPLDDVPRAQCPLTDERLIESAAGGLLPLTIDGDISVAVAPRGLATRRLLQAIKENPSLAPYFRFTSAERLNRIVLRHVNTALGARATVTLKRTWPTLSAAPPRWRMNLSSFAAVVLPALTAFALAPASATLAFDITLAALFVAWLGLRLAGASAKCPTDQASSDLSDDQVPVYTVIAALYREAASVDGLLQAIERLDYPPEKLDVIVAVEADDAETRAALAARTARMPITVITVPALGPRTKPKALNVALPFARGTFTVIYDAEDRPEPNQLRLALRAFRGGGHKLACVQARLCIDNSADSWLAALFTAEYAGQFDVFLPGLAALCLPLPLGGSSNHFYTATLREIGGWDPFNVTEDADLGMRLARFGYRTGVINSTTYEEAPARLGPWLRQRTRWFKGWMQTWLVHMRRPTRLLRDLGTPGFVTFQLIVGGNALAALVHPLFIAGLIVCGGARRAAVEQRQHGARDPRGGVRRYRGGRLSNVGFSRLARLAPARVVIERLGAAVDAAALVAAVAGRLARPLSASCRALYLGKDRAWTGKKFAPRCRLGAAAARTRAPPHGAERRR